jgi:hypothetical protein
MKTVVIYTLELWENGWNAPSSLRIREDESQCGRINLNLNSDPTESRSFRRLSRWERPTRESASGEGLRRRVILMMSISG